MKRGIEFQFFPRSQGLAPVMLEIVGCVEEKNSIISSSKYNLSSNEVLEVLRPSFEKLGFSVEKGKKKNEKIPVPVLFGRGNYPDKYFYADAVSSDHKVVIEVEAGRAVDNNQFLKDIFQASMMHEVEYLVLVVRKNYRGNNDFEKIFTFLETLYVSSRLKLPLKGILLIGY